jgi:AcrR family transcriptional regulator
VTVDWQPGLREQKKRALRARLTSTATRMFLERGFEAVRVSEIADACGVSEKTVFNYFPTKEALLLDRFADTLTALRAALSAADAGPLDAAVGVLDAELGALTGWIADHPDPADAVEQIGRFRALAVSTPGLRAYRHEMAERLTDAIAEHLGGSAPESRIAAIAVAGLWRVQADSVSRHLTAPDLHARVTSDVARAAALIAPMIRSRCSA